MRGVFSPSRRTLLAGAAATGLLPAVRTSGAPMELSPVVSFHMDQPFLDMTGRGKPYLPPVRVAPQIPQAVFDHHPYL